MDRPFERQKVFNEVLTVSSAAGATSMGYSMKDCDRISFVVGYSSIAASTATVPAVTVVQSGDKGLTTNATMANATATPGSGTTSNLFTGAKAAVITMTTAATLAEVITLNGVALTYSTTPNSTNATALSFGSTIGATAAGGLDGTVNSLASVINAATVAQFNGVTATTISTAAIRLLYDDSATASSGVNTRTTGGGFSVVGDKSQVIIEIGADDLNSTSQYVGIRISSADTSVNVSVCAVKAGMRYKPAHNVGQTVRTT